MRIRHPGFASDLMLMSYCVWSSSYQPPSSQPPAACTSSPSSPDRISPGVFSPTMDQGLDIYPPLEPVPGSSEQSTHYEYYQQSGVADPDPNISWASPIRIRIHQSRDTDPAPDLIRHWNRFQVQVSSPHIINTINKQRIGPILKCEFAKPRRFYVKEIGSSLRFRSGSCIKMHS